MRRVSGVYGLMAEFLTADEILAATRRAREAGYRDMDAYTPYAVEGLAAELGMSRARPIPFLVLLGGLGGAAFGFWMQYYSLGINYAMNVGGRPYNSWPVYMPIAFEVLILVGALSAFLGMLLLNGLPHPHHPVFNEPRFARSSQDRFFLSIEATDPLFDRFATAEFLATLRPHGEIMEIPHEAPAEASHDQRK